MKTIDIQSWLSAVRQEIEELNSQAYDHHVGTNMIFEEPPTKPLTLTPHLDAIYDAFDGASLPDVHVGYFIDRAGRAATAQERGEPAVVTGREPELPIQVFASDGGGSRFAVGLHDGVVYYLPSWGEVRDGKFIEDTHARVERVAASVSEFLHRLLVDLRAHVAGDHQHTFMAR